MKEKKLSLRSVLKIAYTRDEIKYRKKANKNFVDDEDRIKGIQEEYDSSRHSNYSRILYEIMDGLYCLANMITNPPEDAKPTRWISDKKKLKLEDIDECTACMVLALMSMDSSRTDTFISKLKNKRIYEITEEEKKEYLSAFLFELKNACYTFSDIYISNPSIKKPSIVKERNQEFSIIIDNNFENNFFSIELQSKINSILDAISKELKQTVNNVFPNNLNYNVPFPSKYDLHGVVLDMFPTVTLTESDKEDDTYLWMKYLCDIPNSMTIYSSLKSGGNSKDEIQESLRNSPLLVLDADEKQQVLNSLQMRINMALKDWVNEIDDLISQKEI